jgi:TPR repeat protein
MKKLLLALSISLAFSSVSFAEVSNTADNNRLEHWKQVDEKYASQVVKMNIDEALAIEKERFSTKEEFFIAGLFYLGDEKYQNKRKALDLFMIASDAGFVPAQYMAGKLLVSGDAGKSNLYMGKDLLKTVGSSDYDEYYKSKANETLAQLALDSKNFDEAVTYLSKLKSKDSLYRIAKLYEYRGDKETARIIYEKAIDAGYIDAKIEIATIYLEKGSLDTKKAISMLTEIADHGTNPDIVGRAQTLLGDIYFYGNQQMYANHEEGVKWYKRASDNGYYEGMIKLHKVYLENEPKNIYRLGSNKYYIHDLGEKIRKTIDNEEQL